MLITINGTGHEFAQLSFTREAVELLELIETGGSTARIMGLLRSCLIASLVAGGQSDESADAVVSTMPIKLPDELMGQLTAALFGISLE